MFRETIGDRGVEISLISVATLEKLYLSKCQLRKALAESQYNFGNADVSQLLKDINKIESEFKRRQLPLPRVE